MCFEKTLLMLNPHVMLILFQQLLSETEGTTYTISKLNNIAKIIFGNRNFNNVSDLGLKAYHPNKISFVKKILSLNPLSFCVCFSI